MHSVNPFILILHKDNCDIRTTGLNSNATSSLPPLLEVNYRSPLRTGDQTGFAPGSSGSNATQKSKTALPVALADPGFY